MISINVLFLLKLLRKITMITGNVGTNGLLNLYKGARFWGFRLTNIVLSKLFKKIVYILQVLIKSLKTANYSVRIQYRVFHNSWRILSGNVDKYYDPNKNRWFINSYHILGFSFTYQQCHKIFVINYEKPCIIIRPIYIINVEKLLEMCPGAQDRCSSQVPGSGSYCDGDQNSE